MEKAPVGDCDLILGELGAISEVPRHGADVGVYWPRRWTPNVIALVPGAEDYVLNVVVSEPDGLSEVRPSMIAALTNRHSLQEAHFGWRPGLGGLEGCQPHCQSMVDTVTIGRPERFICN